MSILNNALRCGKFTSSEIYLLTKPGKVKGEFSKPAITYINRKNMERRLGRPVGTESNAKPLLWGKLCEQICFEKLGLEYTLCSQETVQHPTISCWAGSADCVKHDEGRALPDIKAPYTLESFCNLVQPLYDGLQRIEAINAIRASHDAGEAYYWQIVSNAIIHDCNYGELIVYMPYESELEEIRQAVEGNGQYYWLYNAVPGELPYLPDGGYYKNINTIRWEIEPADKNFLIEQVIKASKLLINI